MNTAHMTDQHSPLTTIVVGAGPGIGLSVARRFSAGGGRVGLIARSAGRLGQLAETLTSEGVAVEWETADASAPDSLRSAIRLLTARLGGVDAVCFSPLPAIGLIRPVLETGPEDLMASLSLSVGGAATVVEAIAPTMIERGHGSLLFTTGSGGVRPSPQRAASAVSTAAETTYVNLLHQALTPVGVRVAQLVVVGAVGPGEAHEPDDVAEALWRAHNHTGEALTMLRDTSAP